MNKLKLLVLPALVMMSCTRELPVNTDRGGVKSDDDFTIGIRLRGGMPSEPGTYSDYLKAETSEYTLTRLTAVMFDDTDRYSGAMAVSAPPETFKDSDKERYDKEFAVKFDVRNQLKKEDGTNFTEDELVKKEVRFFFVANMEVTELENLLKKKAETKGVDKIYKLHAEDFKDLEVSRACDAANWFVMLGLPAGKNGLASTVLSINHRTVPSIELERLSARICVKIDPEEQKKPEEKINAGLAITKVKVVNRQTKSYLYEKAGIPSGTHLVSPDKANAPQGQPTNFKEYTSGFDKIYSYENSIPGNLTLEISLTLNGKPLKPVNVPFENIAIKRNHYYTVLLNRNPLDKPDVDDKAHDVLFTINVTDWNKVVHYHSDYKNNAAPILFDAVAYNADFSEKESADTTHLRVSGKNSSSGKAWYLLPRAFNVMVEIKNPGGTQCRPKMPDNVDWFEVEEISSYAGTVIEPGFVQTFKIKVGANETGQIRIADLKFLNMLDETKACTVRIEQDSHDTRRVERLWLNYEYHGRHRVPIYDRNNPVPELTRAGYGEFWDPFTYTVEPSDIPISALRHSFKIWYGHERVSVSYVIYGKGGYASHFDK